MSRPSTRARSAIANVNRSTADYHQSLLQVEIERQSHDRPPHLQLRGATSVPITSTSLSCTSDNSIRLARKASGQKKLSRDRCTQLSRQELDEFEALPLAIRRKYFSTLERLRFAKTSDHIYDDNYNEDDRLDGKVFLNAEPHRDSQGSTRSDTLVRQSTYPPLYRDQAASDTFLPLNLSHPNLKQHHLTRDEQVALARQLRASVILDAADEAIGRATRQLSTAYTPSLSSTRPSMESPTPEFQQPQIKNKRDSLHDAFRWLDEDEDLDLSLFLDDYHANLREALPLPTKDNRPSFRRHLSITKLPFGRSSISTSRPATQDASSTPTSPTPTSVSFPQHIRRKSRALSLIAPKHATQEALASFDPGAAHYQDPEARLKLRVYLASPQKFDEAIEFGFPSNDALTGVPKSAPHPATRRQSRRQSRREPDDPERFKTFLADDGSSIYSDDMSEPDPESPKTPLTPDKLTRSARSLGLVSSHLPNTAESYAQAPASSREMTLRMTLTRPDLRACEDHIYGWQRGPQRHSRRVSQPDNVPRKSMFVGDNSKPKENLDKFFASLDDEAAHHSTTDGGVVKRFWNKVRRN
ncbi:uncharacterized protein BCR38DRAFT_450901 [Pseudomassariella vexata]|uniref:Mucin n=1 Tax=Pseudomassariella vexata TaxID=1141098 RepID=A0A1Y2DBP3_9PEZI|nr:uncharacterized protein BCR38DRAFT_450901 [Pseudomassariella vexata]ORY56693.1 hypothetical protein BCR38DRAFT_450901 [Pseudomassariella vexata]